MRKQRLAVLLAAVAMLLPACSGRAISDVAPEKGNVELAAPAVVEKEEYEKPEYEIVPFTTGNQAKLEDGTVLAVCNYQTVRLALHNEDVVSPEDAEMAARNIETFNEKMDGVSEEFVKQGEELAVTMREVFETFDALAAEYEDDAETSAVFTGDILSVCVRRYSFTGGAHSNSYVMGWLFDLQTGQFILDPSQLAEDPQSFHDGAAALLIEKADSDLPGSCPGGYWDDYQDIIREGHAGVTLFDGEGMTVLYAPYVLGPYAIGEVELHLSWEELEPLLGQGGMERFGM